jgi:ribosomal protein L40E
MFNPLPPGRVSLKEFCRIAGISKNTFFLRYRYQEPYVSAIDMRSDRSGRFHLAEGIARVIAGERSKKKPHGNKGRPPKRLCNGCGAVNHPRHDACRTCGAKFNAQTLASL